MDLKQECPILVLESNYGNLHVLDVSLLQHTWSESMADKQVSAEHETIQPLTQELEKGNK